MRADIICHLPSAIFYYIYPMPFETVITTSFGAYKCTIARNEAAKERTYSVGVLRQNTVPGMAYEIYHAIFTMKWNGTAYESARHPKSPPKTDYWIELEDSISKFIVANQ